VPCHLPGGDRDRMWQVTLNGDQGHVCGWALASCCVPCGTSSLGFLIPSPSLSSSSQKHYCGPWDLACPWGASLAPSSGPVHQAMDYSPVGLKPSMQQPGNGVLPSQLLTISEHSRPRILVQSLPGTGHEPPPWAKERMELNDCMCN
jgi:hypothetical protein